MYRRSCSVLEKVIPSLWTQFETCAKFVFTVEKLLKTPLRLCLLEQQKSRSSKIVLNIFYLCAEYWLFSTIARNAEYTIYISIVGQVSVVGIATGLGLDGLGTTFRWVREFLRLSRPNHIYHG